MAISPKTGNSGGGSSSVNQSADILLALILEIGGLAIVTAVAGISDKMATLVMWVMFALFTLWLINNTSKFSGFLNAVSNVEKVA